MRPRCAMSLAMFFSATSTSASRSPILACDTEIKRWSCTAACSVVLILASTSAPSASSAAACAATRAFSSCVSTTLLVSRATSVAMIARCFRSTDFSSSKGARLFSSLPRSARMATVRACRSAFAACSASAIATSSAFFASRAVTLSMSSCFSAITWTYLSPSCLISRWMIGLPLIMATFCACNDVTLSSSLRVRSSASAARRAASAL
mmetsp:Transcript_20099/g.62794  ORF Transcript_20099/g.62794 Transcript_20099/m.62794 type:complete len:208 (+) Transcript_20099:849-1472(+)